MPATGTHAVVIGCGVAGVLAAATLARHAERVTVLDRDRLPDDPSVRPGVPQGHHAHVLLAGGARVVDALLPGTTHALVQSGAHYVGMPDDIVTLTPYGWLPRCGSPQFLIGCTRGLTDWVLRRQLAGASRVSVFSGVEVVGLRGDTRRIAGVRARDRAAGAAYEVDADFVVVASGASSPILPWLADLGVPAAREEVVDAGLAYATRLYHVPRHLTGRFPAVNIQLDPRSAGQGGVLLSVEGDRWLVTLMGLRGAEPPTDEAGFGEFARNLRHPVIAELLETARPAGPIRGFRNTVNRRRRFERVAQWPDNLVVLGDAACTFNPSYGHGMSVTALGALALGRVLDAHGVGPGSGRRGQRALAREMGGAWTIAVSSDLRYPATVGGRRGGLTRLQHRYLDRVGVAATSHLDVTRALLDAYTLSGPPTRLFAPPVVLAALRGTRRRPDAPPPLTPDQAAALSG